MFFIFWQAFANNTNPTYSSSSARGRVTAYALENAHRQLASASAYICWRKTSNIYVVLRREFAATTSCVSRFLIPRVVSVCNHGRLHCTCKFFERHGFPCRHIYTITGRVDATDFDIRWWHKYGQMYGEPGIATVVSCFVATLTSMLFCCSY